MRLRPFVGLVPTGDVAARTIAGSVRSTERLQRRSRHPRHVAWLEAGDTQDVADVDEWIADGSLRADEAPSLRIVETRLPSGREVIGLLGLAGLSDLVPHETTDPQSVRRRAERDGRQQVLSRPLLAVLPVDPPGVAETVHTIRAGTPELDVVDDDGQRHRTWTVDDASAGALMAALTPLPCLLADGHHRVAAAMTLGQTELPAFVALASHPPAISRVWRIAAVPRDHGDRVAAWVASLPGGDIEVRHGDLVAHAPSSPDELGVEASHRLARAVPGVARVTTTADPTVVAVATRDGAAIVSSEPPTVGQVLQAVASGRALPPKSTAFTPKPRIGLVLHRVTDPAPAPEFRR